MSTHKSFELTFNMVRKNIKMHLAILKGLCIAQVAIIILLFRHGSIFKLSFAVYLLWPAIIFFFHKLSKRQFTERTRRGSVMIAEEELAEKLPPGSLPLSETIILPYKSETTHVFIGGATGTGKSQAICGTITQLRARKAKCLFHGGKQGEIVARFYNPDTDFIFNPFDERSLYFDVFDVIDSEPDFDTVAASVIPGGRGQEKFFCQAARDVLSGILRYCFVHKIANNDALWKSLTQSIPTLHKMLKEVGSNAAATIENHDSVQTQGVISTLMQNAKIFRYMVKGENKQSLSLREWLRDDSKGGFIFLNSVAKQRETLRGIFTLFINAFAEEILSLRDNPDRRIFIMLDEFGSLHPLNAITDILTLGRSKGCSIWIGIQDKARIDTIYGKDMSNSIINQCNNYIIFRMNDSDSAEYFSRLFGEKEAEVMESTFSSGTRDYRDTESYRNQRITDKLLLPSQIQSLPNLSCYIKLSSYPLTESRVPYKHYPDRAKPFVADKRFVMRTNTIVNEQPEASTKATQKAPEDITASTPGDTVITDFDF